MYATVSKCEFLAKFTYSMLRTVKEADLSSPDRICGLAQEETDLCAVDRTAT